MKVSLRAGWPKTLFCSGSWGALLPLLNFTFHLAGGVTWQLQTKALRAFCFHLTLTSCEGLQHSRKKIFPLSMTSPSQEWRKGGGWQEKERRGGGGGTAGDSRSTICSWLIVHAALLTLPLLNNNPTNGKPAAEAREDFRDSWLTIILIFSTLMQFLRALSFTSHFSSDHLWDQSKQHECWGYVRDSCCYLVMWHLQCVLTRCKVTSFQQQVISLSTVKVKYISMEKRCS